MNEQYDDPLNGLPHGADPSGLSGILCRAITAQGLCCICPAALRDNDSLLSFIALSEERAELDRLLSSYGLLPAEGESDGTTVYRKSSFLYSRPALLVRIRYADSLSDAGVLFRPPEDGARLSHVRSVLRENLCKNGVLFSPVKQPDLFRRFLKSTAFRYPTAGRGSGLFFLYSCKNFARLVIKKLIFSERK